MITEKDLQEAIAECLGKKNPDSSTCIKLAAFYTIQNELYGSKSYVQSFGPSYSFAPENIAEDTIYFNSGTEFSDAIRGKQVNMVLPIIDELMTTLRVLQPRLYSGVMAKLEE